MEQRNELPLHSRRDIAALVKIAPMAGKTTIGFVAYPTVLAGDDVFDVERDERQLVLVQTAVFAPIIRPLANETAKRGVDGHDGQRGESDAMTARALACNTPMKLIART